MSVTWGVAVRSLNDVLRTTLLTKRRAVDHCRTASCLCRMP
ncbi:putative leader peptide [Thermasporomyces composti]